MRCVSYVFNNQYFAEECLQFKVRLFHYRPELLKGLPKPPVLNRFMTQNYYEKLPNGDWDSFIDRKVMFAYNFLLHIMITRAHKFGNLHLIILP